MGATFAAIDSLRTMNALFHGDTTEGVSRWIARQQDMSGGFKENATSKRPNLSATSCAVRCLGWLRATTLANMATASEFLTCQWQQSRQTLVETHLAASALEALGVIDASVGREMRRWVQRNLPRILTLRTDRYALPISLYLEIARFALKDSPEELTSIEAHMRSKVEHAMRRILKSSRGEDGLPKQ
jgi:hypothetical protein